MSAVRYSQLFQELGHDSVCVVLENSPLSRACNETNISHQDVRKVSKIWPFELILKLRSILRANNTDVVFVHHLKDLFYLVPALIGLKKIKLVGLAHMIVSKSKKDPLHTFLYSFLEKMIVFTDAQKRLSLPVLPIKPERYEIIPGFVQLKDFDPSKRSEGLRKKWEASHDEILIGTIGRLDEQKGQAELLEALALVREREPELRWKAVFIGAETAGEEKKGYALKVRGLLKSLKFENQVQMLGFLPDPSVAIASLDVFVLPSYRETFGLVVLEAMTSGVACLVTDAGGPPDIVGTTGIKFAPRDVESLAQALISVLKDPLHRQSLVKASLERVRLLYSREVVGQQLAQLLKSLKT